MGETVNCREKWIEQYVNSSVDKQEDININIELSKLVDSYIKGYVISRSGDIKRKVFKSFDEVIEFFKQELELGSERYLLRSTKLEMHDPENYTEEQKAIFNSNQCNFKGYTKEFLDLPKLTRYLLEYL